MQVETALFFETPEEIYARVFSMVKPRTPIPEILIRFKRYANANSKICLAEGRLTVEISDLLEGAPAPIQESLAHILISKLYRRPADKSQIARYKRYLNRPDVRRTLHLVRQERGRKLYLDPKGEFYDLVQLFEELNLGYFHGLMARPQLGWSLKPSRSTLGHYDPSHNAIILSRLLDNAQTPSIAVQYVMFHEMLHLRFPTRHNGTRRCVHTPEFKQAEQGFADYKHAKKALKTFVESAMRRSR